jgi:hypothetical protein
MDAWNVTMHAASDPVVDAVIAFGPGTLFVWFLFCALIGAGLSVLRGAQRPRHAARLDEAPQRLFDEAA